MLILSLARFLFIHSLNDVSLKALHFFDLDEFLCSRKNLFSVFVSFLFFYSSYSSREFFFEIFMSGYSEWNLHKTDLEIIFPMYAYMYYMWVRSTGFWKLKRLCRERKINWVEICYISEVLTSVANLQYLLK